MITIISGPQGSGKTKKAKEICPSSTIIQASELSEWFKTKKFNTNEYPIDDIETAIIDEADLNLHNADLITAVDNLEETVICTNEDSVAFSFLESLTSHHEVNIITLEKED